MSSFANSDRVWVFRQKGHIPTPRVKGPYSGETLYAAPWYIRPVRWRAGKSKTTPQKVTKTTTKEKDRVGEE